MSLQYPSSVRTAKQYLISVVEQVIVQDVIQNGRVVFQKYSIKRRINKINNVITRRYFGDKKFISLPKIGQYVYIWFGDNGYFWHNRHDRNVKKNLGLDWKLGDTIVSGTNHDIIVLNGVDQKSDIRLYSFGVKSKDSVILQLAGQAGNASLIATKRVNIAAVDVMAMATGSAFLSAGGKAVIQGKKTVVLGDDSVQVKNSRDGKTQPMVLGDKYVKWQQDLLQQVKSFLDNYTAMIKIGLTTAGSANPMAGTTFDLSTKPLLSTLFVKQKNSIKQNLSKKNKVQ